MNKLTMGPTEWLLLLLLSVLWGGSFFFNKLILTDLPPLTLVLGRTGLAALVLIVVIYSSGQRLPATRSTWLAFCLMGALNNLIPFSLIVWGQQYIDSSLASVLNATTPLFTIVLAHWLTRDEKLTVGRYIGVALGISGVIVLIGIHALSNFTLQSTAQVAILGAACSYGLAGIFGRRFRGLPPLLPAAGMLTCTALMMAPIAAYVDQPWQLEIGLTTWGH